MRILYICGNCHSPLNGKPENMTLSNRHPHNVCSKCGEVLWPVSEKCIVRPVSDAEYLEADKIPLDPNWLG